MPTLLIRLPTAHSAPFISFICRFVYYNEVSSLLNQVGVVEELPLSSLCLQLTKMGVGGGPLIYVQLN